MSWILHLETSTKVCSVALSKDGELQHLREIADDQYAHGEQLTILIEYVLKDAGIMAPVLSAVSVASGPGSYTGLRIGVSTAKGLCYALNIPLIAVDTLTSLAFSGREKHPEKTLCPMIDARRMEVYATIFSKNLEVLKPLGADVLDENSYRHFEPFVCYGDGAEKMQEFWKNREVMFDNELRSSAAGQVKPAFEKFLTNTFEDVAYFEPLYLKEFQGAKPKNS
jgi:tRNA threonylcarbamoyladenosine biosynthesis protein TsaB